MLVSLLILMLSGGCLQTGKSHLAVVYGYRLRAPPASVVDGFVGFEGQPIRLPNHRLGLVVSNGNDHSPQPLTIYGLRSGKFALTAHPIWVGDSVAHHGGIAVADVDGDGIDDILVARICKSVRRRSGGCGGYKRDLSGGVLVYYGGSSSAPVEDWYSGPKVLVDGVPGLADLDAQDVDGDGDIDLVTVGVDGVNLYLQSHSRGFLPQRLAESSHLFNVEFADVDLDGWLDVVVSGERLEVFWGAPPLHVPTTFDGNRSTKVPTKRLGSLSIQTGGSTSTVAAAVYAKGKGVKGEILTVTFDGRVHQVTRHRHPNIVTDVQLLPAAAPRAEIDGVPDLLAATFGGPRAEVAVFTTEEDGRLAKPRRVLPAPAGRSRLPGASDYLGPLGAMLGPTPLMISDIVPFHVRDLGMCTETWVFEGHDRESTAAVSLPAGFVRSVHEVWIDEAPAQRWPSRAPQTFRHRTGDDVLTLSPPASSGSTVYVRLDRAPISDMAIISGTPLIPSQLASFGQRTMDCPLPGDSNMTILHLLGDLADGSIVAGDLRNDDTRDDLLEKYKLSPSVRRDLDEESWHALLAASVVEASNGIARYESELHDQLWNPQEAMIEDIRPNPIGVGEVSLTIEALVPQGERVRLELVSAHPEPRTKVEIAQVVRTSRDPHELKKFTCTMSFDAEDVGSWTAYLCGPVEGKEQCTAAYSDFLNVVR